MHTDNTMAKGAVPTSPDNGCEWRHSLRRLQPYRLGRALWLATVSSLLVAGLMILGAIDPDAQQQLEPRFHAVLLVVCVFVLFVALYAYNFGLARRGLRSGELTVWGLVGSLAIAALVSLAAWWAEGALYGVRFNTFVVTVIINTTNAVIAYLISMLLYNVTQHQLAVLENEHLQAENLRMRHHVLEKQLSPHFLFNTLGTLDGLIGTDDQRAHHYLLRLAEIYRYSLRREHETTLGQELDFTHAYLDLMQIRYGDSLHVEEHVAPTLLGRRLPPVSVQLLVENAIGHNVVSQRHPLLVEIKTEGDKLTVSNRLCPKTGEAHGSGQGLTNLAERYRLLYGLGISIVNDGSRFSVSIPLVGAMCK